MREEYLSIVSALSEMEVDFQIIFSHKSVFDRVIWKRLAEKHLIKPAVISKKMPNCFSSFPRDICASPKSDICFLNSYILAEAGRGEPLESTIFSPYGESGRMIHAGNVAMVGTLLFPHDSEECMQPMLEDFEGAGLNIGLLPVPVHCYLSCESGNKLDYFGPCDHIDSEAILLIGRDREIYLLVDSNIRAAELSEQGNRMLTPEESLERIRVMCEGLKIKMVPLKPHIPFAFNLIQFNDGRVLMTGGDDEFFETVEGIVGKGNVKRTSIPIIFFPLYGRGGIRCMTNQFPVNLIGGINPSLAYALRLLISLYSAIVRMGTLKSWR